MKPSHGGLEARQDLAAELAARHLSENDINLIVHALEAL